MDKLKQFLDTIGGLTAKTECLSIENARLAVLAINDFLYANYPDIGTTEALGSVFTYFSDFHKFWEIHHREILNCKISLEKCAHVADALHDVYIRTNASAFNKVYDTYGLKAEDICRIRFLTANQDFRGSRNFEDFVKIYESDHSIFDLHNIAEEPDGFLKSLKITDLSQNDKRVSYAEKIAKFLIEKNCLSPYNIINLFDFDISKLREAMINCVGAGYGNKKTDMFLRDMVVLKVWEKIKNFECIDVASDINTIKVALRTGIIQTEIPLVSSFLDIFCHQYGYIDEMNASAWRTVWELWKKKYPLECIEGPCLIDYFVYNVIGKQFCKESLVIFKGINCNHVFRWHSGRNRTCQTCFSNGIRKAKATIIGKVLPCCDKEGNIAIENTDYVKSLPQEQKISSCPFINICSEKDKFLKPPKSISILGRTGWETAYTAIGEGGGGLMS